MRRRPRKEAGMSRLWYEAPAKEWEEALPLGNGRLGAMVYGDVENEHIQVNEESMWFGGPMNRNNPSMREQLPEIRRLIFAGEIRRAEHLMWLAMSGCPNGMHPYQTLGDITIGMPPAGEVEDYCRELDLTRALCRVSYRAQGVSCLRECFVSHPADCMILRFQADRPGAVSFWAGLERWHFYEGCGKSGPDEICLYGDLGRGGYEFAAKLRVRIFGGSLEVIGERIVVEGADQAILYFSADTTYHYTKEDKERAYREYGEAARAQVQDGGLSSLEKEERVMAFCLQRMLREALDRRFAAVWEKSWEELLARHEADYRALFDRVSFSLEGERAFEDLSTWERVKRAKEEGADAGLSALYFDYGRYLLISCSREGGLPATLQGLWNKDMTPPWDCKHTVNINTEMNYWPAECCALPECHMPLFDLLKKMVPNGRRTAREMYGCRGFVCHHNTDIHGDTAPQDLWIPGTYWVMGAAWLCTHLWTHYEYTVDGEFLAEYFPVMCEAALFFLDFLVEKDGYLVTCPSVSPENTYILPSGEMGANGYGVTMDNQILRDLFTQCIQAARILKEQGRLEEVRAKMKEAGIEDTEEFIRQVGRAREKLIPTRISERGTILEWQEDYRELEPGHRHISHLYGLHPSEQITMDGTPQLAAAARRTLEERLSHGGGHTGWSRAWIINHYAKLWDGEAAYRNLLQLFAQSTYPNLFDRHPPFQIDGNFGAAAAMAEMLIQSTRERVVLLPALPAAWPAGRIRGIRIKGGGEADLSWREGRLEQCVITALRDLEIRIRLGDKSIPLQLKAGESRRLTPADFQGA